MRRVRVAAHPRASQQRHPAPSGRTPEAPVSAGKFRSCDQAAPLRQHQQGRNRPAAFAASRSASSPIAAAMFPGSGQTCRVNPPGRTRRRWRVPRPGPLYPIFYLCMHSRCLLQRLGPVNTTWVGPAGSRFFSGQGGASAVWPASHERATTRSGGKTDPALRVTRPGA